MTRLLAACGAVLAGLGVAAGAFGAHALDDLLSPARMATFDTAAHYQLLHGLALAFVATRGDALRPAATLLLIGTVFFCGSLYLLVATDVGAFGALAPVGGGALIVGWALTARGLWATAT
ncbi:MAG: DUF423 domain-containing protein [Trueperaceae bacterium]